ncbi:MAG: tol-pal system protein YbgF [Thiohalomonadales bacterium]
MIAVVLSVCIRLMVVNTLFFSTVLYAAAPVIDGAATGQRTAQQQQALIERLTRLERSLQGQGSLDLLNRLNNLRQEVRTLTGDIEVLTHTLNTMKKRQRELYLDTDRRLSRMEKSGAVSSTSALSVNQANGSVNPAAVVTSATMAAARTSPMANSGGGDIRQSTINPSIPHRNSASATGRTPTTTASRGSKLERDAYERAFNLLKDGKFTMASASFQAFLEAYPDARYAANAQYWLGEAKYVQRQYNAAIAQFKKVIKNYPRSSKVPDALLKTGYAYYELGNKKQAIAALETIVKKYPSATASRLAKKRLISIKSSN